MLTLPVAPPQKKPCPNPARPPVRERVDASAMYTHWLSIGRFFAGESLRKSAGEHLEHLGAHPDPEAKPTNDPARPSRTP